MFIGGAFRVSAFLRQGVFVSRCSPIRFTNHAASPSLADRVQETLRNEIKVPLNATLVLGVSGGSDSIALLHLLRSIHPNDLHVIHFDHKQRGEESDGDRDFVQDLCQSLRLPFYCRYWNSTSVAFSQDSARTWRRSEMRKLLNTVSTSDQPGCLVTAHHKDDSEETLLLKLLRGVHITRLTGMSAQTRDERGVSWIRPLIHIRKDELVDFLQHSGHSWREDVSNKSNKYLRNRVRNELLPLMRDMMGTESLQRRLETLQAQSTEMRFHLDSRVNSYLDEYSSNGKFLLPSNRSEVDLVVKEALHAFVVRESGGHQFTSFHMDRVWTKIHDHSSRRQWKLNIGDCWDVSCIGEQLQLLQHGERMEPVPIEKLELPWEDACAPDSTDPTTRLIVYLPNNSDDRLFHLSIVGKEKYSMTPPWRRGRSAIRIVDFLRGQGVPLHLRPEATVITTQTSTDQKEEVVAVYVESSKKWVVDAKFSVACKERPRKAAILVEGLE